MSIVRGIGRGGSGRTVCRQYFIGTSFEFADLAPHCQFDLLIPPLIPKQLKSRKMVARARTERSKEYEVLWMGQKSEMRHVVVVVTPVPSISGETA